LRGASPLAESARSYCVPPAFRTACPAREPRCTAAAGTRRAWLFAVGRETSSRPAGDSRWLGDFLVAPGSVWSSAGAPGPGIRAQWKPSPTGLAIRPCTGAKAVEARRLGRRVRALQRSPAHRKSCVEPAVAW